MELISQLLPKATGLRTDGYHIVNLQAHITIVTTSTQLTPLCPVCQTPSKRIHSRYKRTIADLPWATYRVELKLWVRKFLCSDAGCRRRIFTERLPNVVAPWGQRTIRFADWLKTHPGVNMIIRYRSKAYERGAREGAPTAIQVADRFHLLQNLPEALEHIIQLVGIQRCFEKTR